MRRAGATNFGVRIEDISPEGCRIQFVDRPLVGDRVWIKFAGLQAIEATVCWIEQSDAGIRFDRPIHPAVFDQLIATLR